MRLHATEVGEDGHYTHVSIRNVEETLTSDLAADNAYSKYMDNIIMHALSWANGYDTTGSTGFPYSFPIVFG